MSETPRRRIDLSVGAFASTLSEQLGAQSLCLDEHSLLHFELDRKAIGRLSVRGILSEGETDRAAMRLLKSISKKIKYKSLPTPAATPTDAANHPPVESVGPNSEAQS